MLFENCLKGHGTMIFHTFRVVYNIKESDSHAKHGQSFKKQFGRIRVFMWQKSHFHTSFGEFFSTVSC